MSQYQSNLGFDDFSQFFTFLFHKSPDIQMPNCEEQKQLPLTLPQQDLVKSKMQQKTADRCVVSQIQELQEHNSIKSLKNHQIDYDMDIQTKNERVRIGGKDDTSLLNINFKTILHNYFKELLKANELSEQEVSLVRQFGSRSPSFKSLVAFCSNRQKIQAKEVNKLCLKLIESSYIIRKILNSHCNFTTKVQMIKFIEVLRANIKGNGAVKKWKQKRGKQTG